MNSVDWDTKNIVKDILETELDYNIDVNIKSDSDSKIKNLSGSEIRIEENDNRNLNSADITYSAFDYQSVVYLTIRSTDKLDELFINSVDALLDYRTKSRGLTGGWDKLELDDLSVEDPTFNKHTATIRVTFIANSRVRN